MLKSKKNLVLLTALVFVLTGTLFGQTVPPAGSEGKLIAILKSDDASQKEKADACRQLGIIGTKKAVPTLAALLGDEKLSHMARYGLEPIPDPAVDKALREALGKLKGRPLVGVIGSIGVRRDARAVPALAMLLHNPDQDVEKAASRALGSIGTSDAAKALMIAIEADSTRVNWLARHEGLLRCAENLAAEGKRSEAIDIYDQLRKLDDAAHQVRGGALLGAILTRGNDGKIPRRPGETFQRWIRRKKDGVTLLLEQLRSDDYIMFSAAVQAAQELPGPDVTQVLTSELKKLPADNQILIIQTLGKRGDAAAVPTLSDLAKRGDKNVRMAAVKALPDIGDASAAPALAGLMTDSDADISKAAQEALGALPGREVDSAVMQMLRSSNTEKQLTALELIGRRRMKSSIHRLLEVARDAEPKVRQVALKRVGELGNADQLPALLDLLMELKDSRDLNAAEQALNAVLTKEGNPQAYSRKLIGLLSRARPGQKGVLLRLLSVVGGNDALKAVRKASNDSNTEVRAAAIRALCAWRTADAAPDLLTLAKTSPSQSQKTAALRGYIRLVRDESLSPRKKLAMCRQAASLIKRNEEKKLLLGALGTVPVVDALSMAMEHLNNPATKNEAGFAAVAISEKIVQRNPRDVADSLQKVLRATDNRDLTRRARKILNQAKQAAGR